MKTNFLIIGSGVGGLTLAVKLAAAFPNKKITVATKAHESETNTRYAQGGVAAVLDLKTDSFQKHVQDTLVAGDGLCDKEIVEMVIKEGPARVLELMEWGAIFDADSTGNFAFGKEGGHSTARILHHRDSTGREIERSLLRRLRQIPNIGLLPRHFAMDLIMPHHFAESPTEELFCQGAYLMDQISGRVIPVRAGCTILATGGIGQVYGHTTNPAIATGDGIAMAKRAGAEIKNMEFVQFHPTAFFEAKTGTSFLVSEAVRGFGAFLRNDTGERFMLPYHSAAELAPRDIVARAIHFEMEKTGAAYVFLDCTHLDIDKFRRQFPMIYKTCRERKIDPSKDYIPVLPAAHYLCGGIVTDRHGRTSVQNLFACGECACTGLHGANRLASNSILEALVYAHRCCDYLQKHPPSDKLPELRKWEGSKGFGGENPEVKTRALQSLMRECAGVIRKNGALLKAANQVAQWKKETEDLSQKSSWNLKLAEFRNMLEVAQLILDQSLLRQENRGGFFNEDLCDQKTKTTI